MRSGIRRFFSLLQGPVSGAKARWARLSPYWQHFVVAVVLGIGIEAAIHAAHNVWVVKRVQNTVLDTTLQVFSMREKPDAHSPVLLVVDDLAHQSPKWGQGRSTSLEQALAFASHAFERGASHVFLDITFDRVADTEAADTQQIEAFAKRYAQPGPQGARHLYVARTPTPDPCLPRQESLESLTPSVWDAVPSLDNTRPGLLIHAVMPHYRADLDHVVRGWDLFGVLREPINSAASWRFVPSPQLAYASIQATAPDGWQRLPWLKPLEPKAQESRTEFAHRAVGTVPLLVDKGFSETLCHHHPHMLGCAPHHDEANAPTAKPLPPEEALARTNQLLRPLPAEQACRTYVEEVLAKDASMAQNHRSALDLLFNRIVYDMPPWERASGLNQRGYYIRTPLTMQEPDDLDWAGRVVAIGDARSASADWYPTPVGFMPGVLINLNAMKSLQELGPVSSPPAYLSFAINALIIIAVAAIFSAISPLAAAGVSAMLLLCSMMLFHQYLLSRGVWIEFGAPLLGINLHRIIDGYLAHRKLKAAVAAGAQAHRHSP